MKAKTLRFGICLAWMLLLAGCAETGDQSCDAAVGTDVARTVPSSNAYSTFSFIQGPDDNAVIPPTDTVLVSRVTAPRIWTVAESEMPPITRFVARDVPGDQVQLRRANGTHLAAFDGNGTGWLTLQRYDNGGGMGWYVVGWDGAVTVPGDP